MDSLLNILDDERVSVASVQKDRRGNNPGLDKEVVKKQLEIKNQMEKVAKKIEGLSPEERKTWVEKQKEKADGLYKEKKFSDSMKEYLEVLMALNEEMFGKDVVADYKIKICNNMAMCALESKCPEKAYSLIRQSLNVNPDYWKTYYRLAIVQQRTEQFKDSLDSFNMAESLLGKDPLLNTDEKAIMAQLTQIRERKSISQAEHIKKTKEERALFSSALSKSLYTEKPTVETSQFERRLAEKRIQENSRQKEEKLAKSKANKFLGGKGFNLPLEGEGEMDSNKDPFQEEEYDDVMERIKEGFKGLFKCCRKKKLKEG